jgi:hypothetical protein
MQRRHDPSHLSSEATAGYTVSTCGNAGFGLGETGDLLLESYLPETVLSHTSI